MFVTARDKLYQRATQPRRPDEAFDSNILLESCVLHLRNLVDFFYPQTPKQDDVTARSYIPGWGARSLPLELQEFRVRANKELAHITLTRKAGAPPEKDFDFGILSVTMRAIISDFINQVDLKKVPPETIDALRKIGSVVLVTGGPVFHSSSG
jgi:hypothetical protein